MATVSGLITAPDRIRLHYVKIGTAPKVLIAPGVGNEADFEALTRRRTVIFFDIRNRGRSDPVPIDGKVGFPVEVDDLDVVRRHFDLDKVDVIGWSYVGLVAALYAARYPQHVDRLVMACPAPLREQPPPPTTDAQRMGRWGPREGSNATSPVAGTAARPAHARPLVAATGPASGRRW